MPSTPKAALIVLQVLHAGRYGYHDKVVAPSPIRSPINKHTPAELSDADDRADHRRLRRPPHASRAKPATTASR